MGRRRERGWDIPTYRCNKFNFAGRRTQRPALLALYRFQGVSSNAMSRIDYDRTLREVYESWNFFFWGGVFPI